MNTITDTFLALIAAYPKVRRGTYAEPSGTSSDTSDYYLDGVLFDPIRNANQLDEILQFHAKNSPDFSRNYAAALKEVLAEDTFSSALSIECHELLLARNPQRARACVMALHA